MPKFHVKLKLTGFELEIQGAREDAPLLARSAGAQVAALLEPAARIIQGASEATPPPPSSIVESPKRTRVRRSSAPKTGGDSSSGGAIDWAHDVAIYGNALQSWSTAQKAQWLLYVVQKQSGPKDMSPSQIANTFNKHFRQAGQIQAGKVSRDLGRLKTKAGAAVQEDTTKSPPRWYLTQQGEKDAAGLVRAAIGQVDVGAANGAG